jgi:uncharacterized YigZ family protein
VLREKGSRFLAVVVPAADETAARRQLEDLAREHADASHHCWAWRIGQPPQERSSDAGEPAGTAGRPILQVLRGADLGDVLAVVVRWFGGTKLGKGGLARAYAEATRLALADLRTVERRPTMRLRMTVPYAQLGDVKRLVHPPEIELVGEEYSEGEARLTLEVSDERLVGLREALAALEVRGLALESDVA